MGYKCIQGQHVVPTLPDKSSDDIHVNSGKSSYGHQSSVLASRTE